jgi:peptidyl-prolyl cis-trans isomerase D
MLDFIRERAQTWVAWIIVGFISVTFALWGVSNYLSGGGDVPIAEVNGTPISQAQLQSDYLRQRQRLESMLGENYRPEMFSEERMKQQILQELIERELVVNAAGRAGFRIGDGYLSQTIRGIQAFQDNGNFSQAAYDRALRMQGMSPGMFEYQLRRDLVAQQFINGIVDSDFSTSSEQRDYSRLQNQQRRFGYLVVPVSSFAEKATVSEQQIQDYYSANSQRFMVPEQVTIAYLELNVADIVGKIDVTEDELKSRYEAQQLNYRSQEQRRASHILIAIADDKDQEQIQQAEGKLRELKARVEQGESFAELAKEYSEDPGSAKSGGDLGFFGRAVMDKAFEEAVFNLEKGAMSEPVRTAYGLHLIQLNDIQAGEVKTFDQVKEEIRAEIRREHAEQQFFDKAEILANLTYEHPHTLEEASRELNLPIKESAPFSRQGGSEQVTTSPKVIAAAFSEDVLNGGNNSETIEISADQLVVLRLRDQKPETLRPLDEVRTSIETLLRQQQAESMVVEAADAIIKQLQDGANPEQLAQAQNAEWHPAELLSRKETRVDRAVIKAAFALPRPASAESSSIDRTTIQSGDQAIIILSEVTDPAESDAIDNPELTAISRSNGEAAYIATMASLRARGEITIRQ